MCHLKTPASMTPNMMKVRKLAGDVSGNAKEGTYSSEGATASDDF